MHDALKSLGLNDKEIKVYLALLEFGSQPASVIAKKTQIPRPTVLFLFESLLRRGYIRKSQKGRAQFFYADPADLQKAKTEEINKITQSLKTTIPLLNEYKNPFSAQPRISFFEGIEGCRNAYSQLLGSTTEICEFAAHTDLNKMGDDFMENFVAQRAKKKIFMKAISQNTPVHRFYQKLDKKQQRKLKMFPLKKGDLFSSIDIYENKVLLLNLYQDAFAILIESKQVAETLKTIHSLIWEEL